MNHRNAVALPLVLAFVPPLAAPDAIAFRPAEGRTLTKTFEVLSEGESTTSFDSGDRSGSSSSLSTSTKRLVVTDTIAASDDERITRLKRTYDEIESESESSLDSDSGSHDSARSGESELEGATVTFEWDEDDEDYRASSDDVDDDVLLELAFDLDFLALLPDFEVDEGDEWEIDADAFDALTDPWDDFPWEWENSFDGEVRENPHSGDAAEPEIDETKDGAVTATFTGTREIDGVTVLVIELEGEIDVERTVESSQSFDGGSSESIQESTETYTIAGEVFWHREQGRLHSAELEIEIEGSGTSESTFSFGDRDFENESEYDAASVQTYSVVFEEAEE